MTFWHLVHFSRWNHHDLLSRSVPGIYSAFLSSSYDRASLQGYKGARCMSNPSLPEYTLPLTQQSVWAHLTADKYFIGSKMTDPTGRSAPGEINSLLIWQQPHPMYFAELSYRSCPNATTLDSWDEILTATADFMASFAWHNETTNVYDLGYAYLGFKELYRDPLTSHGKRKPSYIPRQ